MPALDPPDRTRAHNDGRANPCQQAWVRWLVPHGRSNKKYIGVKMRLHVDVLRVSVVKVDEVATSRLDEGLDGARIPQDVVIRTGPRSAFR